MAAGALYHLATPPTRGFEARLVDDRAAVSETSVQGNAAEGASPAFTIDRNGDVLGSRFETNSHDLDAEALAMLRRVSVAHGAAPHVKLRQASRACFELWNEADA